jgi:hypothetical protein
LRTDQQIEPKEITAFIKDYFHAASRNDLQNELHFYADRVDYFHNGRIDRRIVERTLRDYYQRWPKRSYRVANVVSYRRIPSRAEIEVVCRVDFSLKKAGRKVKGQTENRFIINAATSDPRIVRVDERRVRS